MKDSRIIISNSKKYPKLRKNKEQKSVLRVQNSEYGFWSLKFNTGFFHALYLAICIFLLTCGMGCYSTEAVKIRVGVNSKIDTKSYKNIAVLDFIETKKNATTDQGQVLGRMIRKELQKSKNFNVMDERSMNLLLDKEIDKDKIEDPDFLISICNLLGVDALIVGVFDFYPINQPVNYIVDRYYPSTGKYKPETQTYIQSLYRLLFHAKVVDGETGKTLFDYKPPVEEKPTSNSSLAMALSGDESDPSSLRSLANRPVSNLILSLIPHYEYEKRILIR